MIVSLKQMLKILKNGCIVCDSKDFKYLTPSHIYRCNNCHSKYATDYNSITDILQNEKEVRLYNKIQVLNDDDIIDTTIKINKKKVLKPKKVSSR